MGDKQSRMVIRLLMVTTSPCFLYWPQRQHYEATQCHSRGLYISTKSQPLPLSSLSKQHDSAHHSIVTKQLGFCFLYILSFPYIPLSAIRSLAFALKMPWISSAIVAPFQKDGLARLCDTKAPGSGQSVPGWARLWGIISRVQRPAVHSSHADAFLQTAIKTLLGSEGSCPQASSPLRQTLVFKYSISRGVFYLASQIILYQHNDNKQLCKEAQGPCTPLHICRLAKSSKAVVSIREHRAMVQQTAWCYGDRSLGFNPSDCFALFPRPTGAPEPARLPLACVLLCMCTGGHCARAAGKISRANLSSWQVK